MVFTEQEQRTVLAVFDALINMPFKEQNKFLGTLTIADMTLLYMKMKYAPYCEKHGIKYEDMTDSDFEKEYREIWES